MKIYGIRIDRRTLDTLDKIITLLRAYCQRQKNKKISAKQDTPKHISKGCKQKKEDDDMPWFVWVIIGVVVLAAAYLIFGNLSAKNTHISTPKKIKTSRTSGKSAKSNYAITADDVQAIKIIKELSEIYKKVDSERSKHK